MKKVSQTNHNYFSSNLLFCIVVVVAVVAVVDVAVVVVFKDRVCGFISSGF